MVAKVLEQEGRSSDAATIRRLVNHHIQAVKKLPVNEDEADA